LGEFADADFGALQVGHDGHHFASPLGRFAHQVGAVHMVLRLAVAEIQAHHIDTGFDHLLQHRHIAGSGAEGGNDFGGVQWHEGPLK
jgi:hypothetical protein